MSTTNSLRTKSKIEQVDTEKQPRADRHTDRHTYKPTHLLYLITPLSDCR